MDISTRKAHVSQATHFGDGEVIQQVSSMRFLGITFSSDLKWNVHFRSVFKKASQRVFLIRNLRRSGCPQVLMIRAYLAFIRPILLYAFPAVCNAPQYLTTRLNRIERRVQRIIGDSPILPDLPTAADSMCQNLMSSILDHPQHPLRSIFLPGPSRSTRSQKVLRPPSTKTSRFGQSFVKYAG